MNTSEIERILHQIGLSKREISIYLHLIHSQSCTVQDIANNTFINRTTAYRYIKRLVNKGLAEWIIGRRGKKVQATSLEALERILDNQRTNVHQLEHSLPSLISHLKMIKPSKLFATQVRYYEKQSGIKQIIWNTLQTTEVMRSFTIFKRRHVIDPAFEDTVETEWTRRKLQDRIITNETRLRYIQKRLVPYYRKTLHIRIIPSEKFSITNDITIYNNVVSIISFNKKNLVGVEIENEEIAKTQKCIFDIVWEVAKPLNQLKMKN